MLREASASCYFSLLFFTPAFLCAVSLSLLLLLSSTPPLAYLTYLSSFLPACLSAYLPACLPACLLAWLPALPASLLACLPTCLSACLPSGAWLTPSCTLHGAVARRSTSQTTSPSRSSRVCCGVGVTDTGVYANVSEWASALEAALGRGS